MTRGREQVTYEREAVLAHGEWRGDEDARAPLEGELHGVSTQLGAGGGESGDGSASELCEGGVALHDDDGAALRVLACARAQTPSIPAEYRIDEQPRDGAEELAVEAEPATELERKCQHPLPERHGRQHGLDEIRGGLTHATPEAGRAEATAFAAERHEVLLDARVALHAREAAAEQSAVEVSVEFAPCESRQRRALEVGGDGGVERLDVVADHGVERRRLRAMALVAGSGRSERNSRMPHDERMGRAPCRLAWPLYAQEIEHERVAKPWFAMASASARAAPDNCRSPRHHSLDCRGTNGAGP